MYRAFWSSMESKYNMTFSGDDRESLKPLKRDSLRDVDDDIISLKEKNPTYNYKKWFYFATIASSTIGYGDVAPKTQEGRIAFIVFSIICIPIMLSFIASCGDEFRKLHTNFLSVFRTYVKGQQGGTPEHLLTFLLISISFAGHVSIGCALFQGSNKWTLIDKVYYHIVTFTTVGLGDVSEPLERQIDNAIPMFFYRVFGLVVLYGALKALYCWYQMQQEALAVLKLTQRPLKARGRISAMLPCCCCRPKLKDEPKVDSTMLI